MDWLEVYEEKVCDYHSGLKLKSLPLLSWDVHIKNYTDKIHLSEDCRQLEKLLGNFKLSVNPVAELTENDQVIVMTDKNLNIIYASSNMVKMSGYLPVEVIGNTPKMFQGPKTDSTLSKEIRTSVNKHETFEATLVNYRKDKSNYKCHIKGYPIFNKNNELVNYLAVEYAA